MQIKLNYVLNKQLNRAPSIISLKNNNQSAPTIISFPIFLKSPIFPTDSKNFP